MSYPEQDPNEQANISGADLAIMVDELNALKAQVNELRKVLQTLVSTESHLRDWELARTLLARTPEQPLAKYRNEVLEEVAQHFDPLDCHCYKGYAEDLIRAMKEVE